MKGEWTEATKEKSCPKCGRDHFCLIGKVAVLCTRIESEKPNKAGYGWYHPLDEFASIAYVPKPKERRVSDAELHARWTAILQDCGSHPEKIGELADQLGVAPLALNILGVEWDSRQWLIPMKNHRCLITGLATRWKNGTKMVVTDSRCGLVYGSNWLDYPGPIYIVEGPSDTAAALTLHLCVIGRPSNIGGVELLVRMLGRINRKIIVIAERDHKHHDDLAEVVRKQHDPACRGCLRCWPGLGGAKHTADAMWKRLHRVVEWAFVPRPHKDLRAWLNAQKIDVTNTAACVRVGQSLMRRIKPINSMREIT